MKIMLFAGKSHAFFGPVCSYLDSFDEHYGVDAVVLFARPGWEKLGGAWALARGKGVHIHSIQRERRFGQKSRILFASVLSRHPDIKLILVIGSPSGFEFVSETASSLGIEVLREPEGKSFRVFPSAGNF